MKNFYFLIIIILLVFTGCSSYYTEKRFPSKEKFYDDFNNFAKNKNVEVTLMNDSSFTILEGASISEDTLTFNYKNAIMFNGYIPVKNIKEIYYKKNWPGIIPGVLFGFGVSFFVAAIGESQGGFLENDGGLALFRGVPIGIVIGGAIGWFIGANYIYQFNP
ncbi:MAG: hypothetical protein ACYC6P_00010 [Ignavibacteriaceae bacterium]